MWNKVGFLLVCLLKYFIDIFLVANWMMVIIKKYNYFYLSYFVLMPDTSLNAL